MSDKVAIGIDLGTTFSCVAIWKDGKVEIIANDLGDRTTPSFVSFTKDERLVGMAAKNSIISNLSNTIYDIKRIIGRTYDDTNIQEELKNYTFNIINSNNKPKISVEYKDEIKEFTPEEISSMILIKMKDIAEAYLGHSVANAVITVPAYFTDAQRQATKDAGTIAGLKVLRIINEPTSAAIAYGLDKIVETAKNILIFDFGGGTHDVSLLSLEDGVFEVKATSGNSHLGGEDIDNRIVDYIVSDFKKQHKLDLSDNKKALRKIKTVVERAKHSLSGLTQTTIDIDSLHEGIDYKSILTRAKFESLCFDIFQKTLEPVIKVLSDSKISKSQINDIVLVGGSTRIPRIQEILSTFFNDKELCKSINPDEAIAYGAAVQAAILSGIVDSKLDQLLLIDVNPLSLGVETSGNTMTILVPRGTTLPVSKTQTFSTGVDNQPAVTIQIYEGERQLTKHNNKLGEFHLKDIPAMPRGEPQIEITYGIDANGILEVSAIEKSSGKTEKITITNDSNRLNKEDIDRMIKEAELYKKEDEILKYKLDSKNKLENYCYGIYSNILNNKNVKEEYKSDLDIIKQLIDEVLEWMSSSNNDIESNDYDTKYTDLEKQLAPLILKVQPDDKDENKSEDKSEDKTKDFDMSKMAEMFKGMNKSGDKSEDFDMSKMSEMFKGMDSSEDKPKDFNMAEMFKGMNLPEDKSEDKPEDNTEDKPENKTEDFDMSKLSEMSEMFKDIDMSKASEMVKGMNNSDDFDMSKMSEMFKNVDMSKVSEMFKNTDMSKISEMFKDTNMGQSSEMFKNIDMEEAAELLKDSDMEEAEEIFKDTDMEQVSEINKDSDMEQVSEMFKDTDNK